MPSLEQAPVIAHLAGSGVFAEPHPPLQALRSVVEDALGPDRTAALGEARVDEMLTLLQLVEVEEGGAHAGLKLRRIEVV